jgi:protoheme IX farnesyltransferase
VNRPQETIIANELSLPAGRRAPWRNYLELTKPRVVALMVFTAVVGMLLASPVAPPWAVLAFGSAGIALVAGSAAAINHLVDQRIDAVMARTRGRPLPRGALGTPQVAGFAAAIGLAGTALLLAFTNPLCAALTVGSLIGYAGVYSLYLKHRTPQNIVIGGAAGAAPPLLGWVAVSGQVDPGALLLFLIIFVWTPAHFWALAIHRRDDYARAGVPMLPVTHGVPFTATRVLQYALALLAITLLPAHRPGRRVRRLALHPGRGGLRRALRLVCVAPAAGSGALGDADLPLLDRRPVRAVRAAAGRALPVARAGRGVGPTGIAERPPL